MGIFTLFVAVQTAVQAQNISVNDLPFSLQQAVEQAAQNAGISVRNVNKGMQQGTVYYMARGRNNSGQNVNIILSEEGKLLDSYLSGQFRVKDGVLYQERNRFHIETVHTPEAGNPDLAPGALIAAVSRFSKVGGNAVAYDLHGFNADGTELSSAMMDHIQYTLQRMGGSGGIRLVINVLGDDAPSDPAGRMQAVKTAARALKDRVNIIYVIDGNDAASLVSAFKLIAPDVVVAGPGGDIEFVMNEKDIFMNKYKSKPMMYYHTVPKVDDTSAHVLLADVPASYDWLDAKNAYPLESQEWEPDNSVLSAAERETGFISLFNGRNLDGWTVMGRNKNGFQVIDGVIEYVEQNGGGLQSRDRYDNFILRYDYKIGPNCNNGVHLRAPRSNRASKIGFEIQMFGDHGVTPNKNSTGSVYDVIAPTVNASKPSGEWNTMEIMVMGSYLRVTMNGQVVQNIDFDDHEELKYRLRDGFIRITDHNDYVAWKNIRIKRL